jgi:hypothetical protein
MPVACSDNEPGVINSSVYAGGRKVTEVAIEEAGDWSKRPGHVVWIGLFEPSDELLQRVQRQLNLHPLAIEDAGKAHQHPKLCRLATARREKRIDGPPPQPTLPAVRHAILELIARLPPQRCHRKWIATSSGVSKFAKVVLVKQASLREGSDGKR